MSEIGRTVRFRRPVPFSRRSSATAGELDLPPVGGGPLEMAGLVAVAGTLMLYAYGGFVARQPTLPGLVVMPLLLLIVSPLVRRARARERRFDFGGLLVLSFSLQMAGAYFRLTGAKDALVYQQVGSELAQHFRQLDFFVETGRDFPGTGFIRYLTGLVHVATGSAIFPTFLVFTLAAFIGYYLLYRALETGFPGADHRRYALLLFLWPSLRFWPSSIGKEAWMVLMLGVISLGAAKLFQHRRGGIAMLLAGMAGASMLRPHVAMMAIVGVFVALLFRRSQGDSLRRTVGKVMAVLVLLIGGTLLASETAEFLDLENLGGDEVSEAFDYTVGQTTQGGSAFTPARVDNPYEYPWALVTVLLRPFPHEASSLEGLLSAAEGVLLVLIAAGSWQRLGRLPFLMLRQPYVVYAISFTLSFAFAFSVIANFGILARQRVQVLPFVFVLLALPSLGWGQPPATRASANRSRPATRLPLTSTASRSSSSPSNSSAPSTSATDSAGGP